MFHLPGHLTRPTILYEQLPAQSTKAEQVHWSDRARAASVAKPDAPGRPRRSVLAFGGKVISVAERMIGVRVSITRYISDEPQPGIVECEFADAHGRRWGFVEKTAIVSAADLDARTSYPQPGIIACRVVGRRVDNTGRELVNVDTERPWGVEAVDGTVQFEVLPASLLEWEWGSDIKRAWDGHTEPGAPPDRGGD